MTASRRATGRVCDLAGSLHARGGRFFFEEHGDCERLASFLHDRRASCGRESRRRLVDYRRPVTFTVTRRLPRPNPDFTPAPIGCADSNADWRRESRIAGTLTVTSAPAVAACSTKNNASAASRHNTARESYDPRLCASENTTGTLQSTGRFLVFE